MRNLITLAVLLSCAAPARGDVVGAPQEPSQRSDVASDAVAEVALFPDPRSTLELEKPSAPTAPTKDWVQLKSGEWLRGAIKRMRDQSLDFDSDELDDLSIKWKDIHSVRSPLQHTYVFEQGRSQFSITGPARIDRTRVFIQLGDEIRDYPRADLVAILRGESRRDYWSGSVSLGLTLRTGNTDQFELSSFGWIRRETDGTRVRLDYNGVFASLNGENNANSHRALLSWDYFLTRKFYVTVARMEVFTDQFQNIDYRLTPSVGLGYKLVRWHSVEWDIDVGGGYQYTRFHSVQAGEPTSEKGGTLVFGTRFESDITKRTDVKLNYKLNLAVSNSAQTSHHAEVTFSVDIYKAIDLDLNLVWDRVEDPPPDAAGNPIEKNDARLVVGFGLEF